MIKQDQTKTVLKPFVVAYSEEAQAETKPNRRAAKHLSRDEATRDVLNRVVKRVKQL